MLKRWAVTLVATTGQYLLLAPLIPLYLLHLLGEWCIEFAEWCCTDRGWVEWLFTKEAALDAWRGRSLGSSSS